MFDLPSIPGARGGEPAAGAPPAFGDDRVDLGDLAAAFRDLVDALSAVTAPAAAPESTPTDRPRDGMRAGDAPAPVELDATDEAAFDEWLAAASPLPLEADADDRPPADGPAFLPIATEESIATEPPREATRPAARDHGRRPGEPVKASVTAELGQSHENSVDWPRTEPAAPAGARPAHPFPAGTHAPSTRTERGSSEPTARADAFAVARPDGAPQESEGLAAAVPGPTPAPAPTIAAAHDEQGSGATESVASPQMDGTAASPAPVAAAPLDRRAAPESARAATREPLRTPAPPQNGHARRDAAAPEPAPVAPRQPSPSAVLPAQPAPSARQQSSDDVSKSTNPLVRAAAARAVQRLEAMKAAGVDTAPPADSLPALAAEAARVRFEGRQEMAGADHRVPAAEPALVQTLRGAREARPRTNALPESELPVAAPVGSRLGPQMVLPVAAAEAPAPGLTTARAADTPSPSLSTPASLPASAASHIVQSLRLLASGDGGEARIRLEPRHLGDVLIVIRVDRGQVAARIEAERPIVREWLDAHQGWLRQSLADQHLTLDRLEIDAPQAEPGSSGRRHDRSSPGEDQPPRRQRKPPAGANFESFFA